MPADAHGPTWMSIALGLLTLLQVIAGYFLARANATLDRVSRLSEQHEVKIESQGREIERLRQWRHDEGDREQGELADRELRRLLLEELRAARESRHRGAA